MRVIRTVAVVTWVEHASADDKRSFVEALSGLPEKVGRVSAFSFGGDLGLRAGNRDFVVVADFESAEDFLHYNSHPAHQVIRDRWVGSLVADAHVVQYPLPT